MRLIDADALARESAEFPHSAMACAFIKRIEEAPTIEAVPVVRCKDCIRWRRSKTNTAAKVCDWDRYEKTENDYCSWAKRKEDDTR